jgi:starch phosphorylase
LQENGKTGIFPLPYRKHEHQAVRIELYAAGVMRSAPARQEMKLARQPAAADGSCVYRAQTPASRPATDYTAQVIPHCSGIAVPLEEAHILWQR